MFFLGILYSLAESLTSVTVCFKVTAIRGGKKLLDNTLKKTKKQNTALSAAFDCPVLGMGAKQITHSFRKLAEHWLKSCGVINVFPDNPRNVLRYSDFHSASHTHAQLGPIF